MDPEPNILLDIIYIIIALLLVIANGFFVASEFAIVKLRATQAEKLAKLGTFKGKILLKVHIM